MERVTVNRPVSLQECCLNMLHDIIGDSRVLLLKPFSDVLDLIPHHREKLKDMIINDYSIENRYQFWRFKCMRCEIVIGEKEEKDDEGDFCDKCKEEITGMCNHCEIEVFSDGEECESCDYYHHSECDFCPTHAGYCHDCDTSYRAEELIDLFDGNGEFQKAVCENCL